MKKIILILSVIFCCSTVFAQQKEKNKPIKYREDKNILFPALEVRMQLYSQNYVNGDIASGFIEYFLDSKGSLESNYSVSAECTYRMFRYLEFGGQIGYSEVTVFGFGGQNKKGFAYYFMPKVRCTWYEYSFVRLYSSVSFGASYTNGSKNYVTGEKSRVIPYFSVVPIGVALGGKKWFGFYEFSNYGDLGHSSFGVGYRFPVK